jgi:carbonic anhydrase/SulP family sulfate permease
MDSRSPAEILFDMGLGDILSVRIAGNVTSPKLLGSIDYAVTVAGAKLVVVLGHTRCGAIAAAIERNLAPDPDRLPPISNNLTPIISDIREAVVAAAESCKTTGIRIDSEAFRDDVTRRNVVITVQRLLEDSDAVRDLVEQGRLAVVGAVYDVHSGKVEFIDVPGGIPGNDPAPSNHGSARDSRQATVVRS